MTYAESDLRLESEAEAEGVKGFVFVFWGVGLSVILMSDNYPI